MKVAAIQMPTVKDKMQNIRTAGTYIEKIKAENPDFGFRYRMRTEVFYADRD